MKMFGMLCIVGYLAIVNWPQSADSYDGEVLMPVSTFGSSPPFKQGTEYDRAWDGNTHSYYDGPESGFTGADFGASYEITAIEYFPREAWEGRMQGGKFEGSDNSEQGPWTTLHRISREPKYQWTGVAVTAKGKFRWVRYSAAKTDFREGGHQWLM